MGHDTLDISAEKQTGPALAELIKQAVLDTQRTIIQPYPSKIKMTHKQFNDLKKYYRIENMFESEDPMFITPVNIMEIEIA